jgi:hypothetical protein
MAFEDLHWYYSNYIRELKDKTENLIYSFNKAGTVVPGREN